MSSDRFIVIRVCIAGAAGLSFAVYWVIACVLAWLVFPIMRWVYRRETWEQRTERFQRIASGGFRLLMHFMRWLRLFDFVPSKAHWVTPDRPFVIIANHPTLVNVVALWSVQRKLCCVAKPGLFRNPILGPILRYCGFIEAGEGMAGGAVIRAAIDRLERGFPVLIFPEGTRSPTGGLRDFSRGAFEIAKRAGCPILPVEVQADPPTLNHGMRWYSLPKRTVKLRYTSTEPCMMTRWGGDTTKAARHFHERYADLVSGGRAPERPLICPGVPHERRSA